MIFLKQEVKNLVGITFVCLGLFMLCSWGDGGGYQYVPTNKNVILTLDGFVGGSWRFASQNQNLANRISVFKEPGGNDYWGPTSKPSFEKIIRNAYWSSNNYYATGGAYPKVLCSDANNLSGINNADPNKQSVMYDNVEISISGKLWFQVMSQCENGQGLWWKFEKQYFPDDWPLTVNASNGRALVNFQYVTSGCLNNGKKYGCGVNDNK